MSYYSSYIYKCIFLTLLSFSMIISLKREEHFIYDIQSLHLGNTLKSNYYF